MKAILRWGAALLSLLLLSSVSHGYVWVSAVFRTPFPQAPDTRNSGYYTVDAYGRWSGPHYYLVPPYRPFGGILPGPTGQAIMSGNLPHDLLLGKQGMSLGNAPLLGAKPEPQQPQPHHGGSPQQEARGAPPMLGSSAMQQFGMMQTPHQALATGQYAMPYANAAPYQQMQAPMGYGPKPMMWAPYPGQTQPSYPMSMQQPGYPVQAQPSYPLPAQQPGPQAVYWRAPNGIWQVQNAPAPKSGPVPFSTIPGFQPGMAPGQGFQPGQPMMPPMQMPMPGVGNGSSFGAVQQFNPMQQFGPIQRFDPLSPVQPPQPNMQPLQLPRMDPMPPPMPQVGGSAYPVHPFTRSPRDFFMWGEVMEQERARANRPLPVP